MPKKIIEMAFKKSTKNTHVYESDNIDLKTVYVGRHAVGHPPADKIKVTIEIVS